MSVLFHAKAIFADFPINISPTYISLNVKFSIPNKTLESRSHFFGFLDQSSCIKRYRMYVYLLK